MKRAYRILGLLLVVRLLGTCGPEPTPTPTPDLVATQVALQQAVAATLTAAAPTIAPTQPPSTTEAPAATPSPTAPATAAPPPTRTPAPTATPRPSATPQPIVWKPEPYTVVGVAVGDVLNIREAPGINQRVVGTIPPHGMDVRVGEPGRQVGESLWVPVWYRGVTGWANSKYLARQVGRIPDEVAARAAQIIWALRNRDMAGLAALVHPEEGVRFSPYTYVTSGDLVFAASQLPGALSDPSVYTWGAFDGTGDPIELTFAGYYERFIYDVDFALPQVVGYDEFVGQGNTINNIREFYPGAITVEYHFEGFDPQYAGMDWRSLRLVLEEEGGTWYLVGIVHDEWTI